jgi:SAM-dependent methyltransferase
VTESSGTRWPEDKPFDGAGYQARIDALAATGKRMHGEADLVMGYGPRSVLDAGCGTGRVGRELARRGVEVVGVDASESMIATARASDPEIEWVVADMGALDLGRTFDLVLMAGNVPLFTPPGTQAALVAGCARHLAGGGLLVCGFQLDGAYSLGAYDDDCAAAGLEPAGRYSTWDRDAFGDGARYAVSVHQKL